MISNSNSEGNSDTHYSSFSSNEKEVLYKAIFSRRDVRSHFISGRVIPNDVLLRILNAAHHAPSVGFSQPWNFILIKDKSIRAQVKESFLREHKKSISMLDDDTQRQEKYTSLKLERHNGIVIKHMCYL